MPYEVRKAFSRRISERGRPLQLLFARSPNRFEENICVLYRSVQIPKPRTERLTRGLIRESWDGGVLGEEYF